MIMKCFVKEVQRSCTSSKMLSYQTTELFKYWCLIEFVQAYQANTSLARTGISFENVCHIFRSHFCKDQAAWNSDFFKNPSFLHILFLLLSIKFLKFFFKLWWLILKLWLVKIWGCFQEKLIFGWKSNFDKLYSEASTGTQVFHFSHAQKIKILKIDPTLTVII